MSRGATILFGGPFVLNIDPIFAQIWGIRLSYHGLAYAIGFVFICLWMMLRRTYIGLSSGKVLDLSIIVSILSLVCGRSFQIFISERDLLHGKYMEMVAFWHGGMAVAGVMAGVVVAVLVFCIVFRKKFLLITDEIVIPLCLLLLFVRIGNHLNGELYGSIADVWWAVKFPHADGFRHPVALYEALKNLIIFFILLSVTGNSSPGQGKVTGHFIFWSSLGAFLIDYLNTSHLLLPRPGSGQFFDVFFIILGLLVIARSTRKDKKKHTDLSTMQFAPISFRRRTPIATGLFILKVILFVVILFFCLTIPSGMAKMPTQDLGSKSLNRII